MIEVRAATVQDVETLVRLRIEMFREMGWLTGSVTEADLITASREYFSAMIPAKRLFAWLAADDGKIVGSSGLIFLCKPPTPDNMSGREGYIMNMYTLPEYRQRGVATALLGECVRFARSMGAGRLSLHASSLGKPVYQKFGFVDSRAEMRMAVDAVQRRGEPGLTREVSRECTGLCRNGQTGAATASPGVARE
ncbi:MAG: GNAT family N-acetyltransferase [Bacillota bacterium]|nr:GNAT family N-acetyltransferase [Bacillota bacterium]